MDTHTILTDSPEQAGKIIDKEDFVVSATQAGSVDLFSQQLYTTLMELMRLGHEIKHLRTNNRMSLQKFARLLGVDKAHVSRIESGKIKPTPRLLRSTATRLHGDLEKLMVLSGRLPKDIQHAFLLYPKESCALIRERISTAGEPLLGLHFSDLVTSSECFSFIAPAFRGKHKFAAVNTSAVSAIKSKKNGVISLFSGAGGLDIGLHQAGFEVSACVELEKDCWETIKLNSNWPVYTDDGGDLFNIKTKKLLHFAGLEEGEAALVVGGAPCQPFSNMGKKLGTSTDDGRLFLEFVRVVKEAKPRALIFENVQGMNHHKHSEVLSHLFEVFGRLGYKLAVSVLNTADYGVPQQRKRLIVLGVRGNKEVYFPLPTHSADPERFTEEYADIGITLPREIRKHAVVAQAFSKISKKRLREPDCKIMGIGPVVKERMRYIKPGENFKVLPDRLRPDCWRSGKHQGADTFGRLRPDRPSVTIRTCAYNPSKGRYIHPYEDRGLNTVEMAAIQSFPESWRFYGSLISVGRQIGNAVPPMFGEKLGEVVAGHLLEAV
jgi:DNA (cytosine-5)-methyltransferase 1